MNGRYESAQGRRLMTTVTPTKPPFGLNVTVWILIVAALLVVLAAMAVYFE